MITLDLNRIRAQSGDDPVTTWGNGPRVRDLCDEIERLRVIVDKLPQDAEGNPVEFILPPAGDTVCPYENLDRISPDDRHELADAIDSGGTLSEEDAKN